jgi:histidine ammonia-lyase
VERAYERVRAVVSFMAQDRQVSPDIVAIADLIARGEFRSLDHPA